MKEGLEKKVDELEVLSTFVHGTLFGLHSLGVVYNLRKKNKVDAVIHTLAGVYDLYATIKHYGNIKK